MVVEFPLVLLLALGLIQTASHPSIIVLVGFVGGIALLIFGALQIKAAIRQRAVGASGNSRGAPRNSFVLGLVLTGLNPFFIIWWLTVGAKIILDAVQFAALYGVLILYGAHIWMDYAWLTTVAFSAKRGIQLLTARAYRWLLIAFGLILVYFGISFLVGALQP